MLLLCECSLYASAYCKFVKLLHSSGSNVTSELYRNWSNPYYSRTSVFFLLFLDSSSSVHNFKNRKPNQYHPKYKDFTMFFLTIVLLYSRVCLSKCISSLYVTTNTSYSSDVTKAWNSHTKGTSPHCIEIPNTHPGHVHAYSKANYSLTRNQTVH